MSLELVFAKLQLGLRTIPARSTSAVVDAYLLAKGHMKSAGSSAESLSYAVSSFREAYADLAARNPMTCPLAPRIYDAQASISLDLFSNRSPRR